MLLKKRSAVTLRTPGIDSFERWLDTLSLGETDNARSKAITA
jgi:hypothetical protein